MAGITPWYVGDTAPAWTIPLTLDTGTFSVFGLTTSNFALLIRNTDADPPSEATGTGIFTNLVAAIGTTTPAQITYIPSLSDTSTLGNFALFIVVNYPNGTVQTLSIGAWQVVAH